MLVAVLWALVRTVQLRRRQVLWTLGLAPLLPPRYRVAGGRGRPAAVVTGGARGIGAAFVQCLVAEGWEVVLVDCDAGAEVEGVVHGVRADARDPGAVDAVVARIRALGLVPSLLVNNVGVSTRAPARLDQHAAAEVAALCDINARFGAALTHALLPLLVRAASGGGRAGVLFVSSGASLVPAPYCSVCAFGRTHLPPHSPLTPRRRGDQGLCQRARAGVGGRGGRRGVPA